LELQAALGDARDPARALLYARVRSPAADTGAAEAVGAQAVALLRAQGAAEYLS
jgi:hypothetical protein